MVEKYLMPNIPLKIMLIMTARPERGSERGVHNRVGRKNKNFDFGFLLHRAVRQNGVRNPPKNMKI